MELIRKYWKYALIVIVSVAVGFFVGRWNTDTVSGVKYLKGEPIHDSVPVPIPYNVTIPAEPILPTKPDTVYMEDGSTHIAIKVDTAKIISEYITENSYSIKAFDNDTIGKLTTDVKVQYNKLKHFSYDFTPVKKVVTMERKPVFSPFVTASFNSINGIGLGGGVYVKKVGASLIYTPTNKSYEVGFHYKF